MRVRIYKPARNAMQSGVARSREWVLEFPRADRPDLDPLMGWTTSEDTQSQVRLRFGSRAEAEAYAKAGNIFSKIGSEPDKGASKLFEHLAQEVDEYMKKISGYGIA